MTVQTFFIIFLCVIVVDLIITIVRAVKSKRIYDSLVKQIDELVQEFGSLKEEYTRLQKVRNEIGFCVCPDPKPRLEKWSHGEFCAVCRQRR